MSKDTPPDDLRYTKDHEWARIQGNRATFGITQFAVEQLGDITMAELPREGEKVDRGKPIGVVESVKAVSDIYAPLSGKVVRTNDPVKDTPETLQEDCYDEGWLVEIELSNPAEVNELMTSQEYAQYIKEQG
jgi:glycine cleavage system H protein